MAGKRKLPLISSRPDDQDPPRPASHWIGFGAVAVFSLWLPLAAIAVSVQRRAVVGYIGDRSGEADTQLALASLASEDRARLSALIIALPIAALALASIGGGYLIGRYGGAAGVREGAIAAAIAAATAGLIASASAGPSWTFFVAIAVAAPFGAVGASLGKKKAA